MENPLGTQDPLDIAVFESIAAHGMEAVTMDMLARRLRCPRTTFFRKHSSWQELVGGTHRRAARLMGWWVPRPQGDLRIELEWWWSKMMDFFASDWGRAFLAIRSVVAGAVGVHAVECSELVLMPEIVKWLGVSGARLRAVWSLMLTAACPTLGEEDRLQLRELVYAAVVHSYSGTGIDDEIAEVVALDALL